MHAITLLKEQHEKVKGLFEQYEKAKTTAEKAALFEELADGLAVHTTIEERVFYPAVYASKTGKLIEEALQEHLSVKRLIVDLSETSPEDATFDAKMKVMQEQVEHHVAEEENKLFPDVCQRLDDVNLEALGAKMQTLFSREMKKGPSRNLGDQIDEAPSLT